MADDPESLVIPVRNLEEMLEATHESAFSLTDHFNPQNIVDIAKSQFPRLEAEVAISAEVERTKRMLHLRKEMEITKRLLIVVAAVCLIAGAALVVFAPTDKAGISYANAALLGILPLGAIGIEEFRIRTVGASIEAGKGALLPAQSKSKRRSLH